MKPFKVVTFNILGDWDERQGAEWGQREDAVAATIADSRADIVGLQEVTFAQRRSLDPRLPGLRRIPFVEHARQITPHTDDPLNTILVNPDRFRVERYGVFWLGLDPARPSRDWDAAFPRCATWAWLADVADGAPLLFVSTHFDHDSELARRESGRCVLAFLEREGAGPGGAPAILVGDFNTDASLDLHRQLRQGPPPLLDAWEVTNGGPGAPYQDGTYHDFSGKALVEVGRIDWVLFCGPLAPESVRRIEAGVEGRYPSDHFPLAATFRRTGGRPA